MKHIGLLLFVIFLSACQSDGYSEIYTEHMSLNEKLLLLESENVSLKHQLYILNNPQEEETPVDADSYRAVIETFVNNLTSELNSINETINRTESHSIALSYGEIQPSVGMVNQIIDGLHTEVGEMSLSESQKLHFEGLQEANEELRAILDVLRRGVETNDFDQVTEARENLADLNNKY